MTREKDLEEILRLKDGEEYTIPESDYGKAEVWLKNGMYFFFEIPMYGGEPQYSFNCSKHNLKEHIDMVYSLT